MAPAEPRWFVVGGWSFPGTALFARKSYQRSGVPSGTLNQPYGGYGGTLTETTTFDLWHTPAP